MPGNKTTIDFDDDLWLMLRSYMAATDACQSKVIRSAVRRYIEQNTSGNEALKTSYEQEQAKLLATAGGNISLITPKRKPRRSSSSSAPSTAEALTKE